MDTGRVLHRRYQLQRLIQRGTVCAVYQAFDQMLQRPVAVKVAPNEHIPVYRAALRSTAQFAHPNIIGIYDLIIEPDALYIVQEYVDGGDFASLLRTPLASHQIADIGAQICQALLYAGTPSRKVSHGDLTPSTILRDRRGFIRVNNFALPSDIPYFSAWSVVGGGSGSGLSDPDLPWGQMSDGRKEDDTRAVGLLLYQLLAGRSAEAVSVEPPADGRLRFMRNVPAQLCEVVARAVIRQHPEHIRTPEVLHAELKALAETLEIVAPASVSPEENFTRVRQHSPLPASGPLLPLSPASPMPPIRDNTTEENFGLRKAGGALRLLATEAVPLSSSSIANMPMQLAAARQAAYANLPSIQKQPHHITIPVLLLIGLVLFALFFGLGYILAHAIFP